MGLEVAAADRGHHHHADPAMSTIDHKWIIDLIIEGNGIYPGDEGLPPVVKIVEYTNAWDKQTYGTICEGQPLDLYRETQFVRNPKTIWTRRTH